MSLEDKAKQRELRIITEVGQVAVKHFVERLREWCATGEGFCWNADEKASVLLDYADKLIEQMDKENEG